MTEQNQSDKKMTSFIVLMVLVPSLLLLYAISANIESCDSEQHTSTSQSNSSNRQREQYSSTQSQQSTSTSTDSLDGLRSDLRRACLASLAKARSCGEMDGLGTTQEKLEALCPDLFREDVSAACLRDNIGFQSCSSLYCDNNQIANECSRLITGSCN